MGWIVSDQQVSQELLALKINLDLNKCKYQIYIVEETCCSKELKKNYVGSVQEFFYYIFSRNACELKHLVLHQNYAFVFYTYDLRLFLYENIQLISM